MDEIELKPCPICKKPPGTKVGPPALARCITAGCFGRERAADTFEEWNARATIDRITAERDGLEKCILQVLYDLTNGASEADCISKAIATIKQTVMATLRVTDAQQGGGR